MSKTNQKKQQQQLFDVDEDVPLDSSNYGTESHVNHDEKKIPATTNESASTATTSYSATPSSSSATTTTSSSNSSGTNTMSLRAFALPDGRIMDAKNTLQSFDHVPMSAQRVTVATAAGTKHPVVRNGNETKHVVPARASRSSNVTQPSSDEVIDTATLYKPTDTVTINPPTVTAVRQSISSLTPDVTSDHRNVVDGVAPTNTSPNDYPRDTYHSSDHVVSSGNDVIHAQAVAVHSVLVLAEGDVLESQFPPSTNQGPNSHYQVKRSTVFWAMMAVIVVLVCIIGVVGGYCGSGQCGAKEEKSLQVSTTAPVQPNGNSAVTNTKPPTIYPIVAPLPTTVPTVIPTPLRTDRPVVAFNAPNTTTGSPVQAPAIDLTLVVACSFLSYTTTDDLSACQTLTHFNGTTVGNTIPTGIGLLTQLTHLNLSTNLLTSTIPLEIGLLTQLTYLDLSTNSFSGTIPYEIGKLTQLYSLNLYQNSLRRTIPAKIGLLTQLTYLDLDDNALTGTIPSEFGMLTQLTYLGLHSNKLC